jgi:hypothetical protein
MATHILNNYINEINQENMLIEYINRMESNIGNLKDIIGDYMEVDYSLKLKDKKILRKIRYEDLQKIKETINAENSLKNKKIKELENEMNEIVYENKLVNKEKMEVLKEKENIETQVKNFRVIYIYIYIITQFI